MTSRHHERSTSTDSLSELPQGCNPGPVCARGYTVREVSRRYRVSPARVRAWIAAGDLGAVNVAAVLCGRPRLTVTPESLAAFEARRQVVPTTKPARRQRRRPWKDYYPD
jgi:hypothetical protein